MLLPAPVSAQSAAPSVGGATTDSWRACAGIGEPTQRLACFDRWSASQQPGTPAEPARQPAAVTESPRQPATVAEPPRPLAAADSAPAAAVAGAPASEPAANEGCHDHRYSALSRFWELDHDTDCGVFSIRGYRPISLSVIASDGVAVQPTSENPLNNAPTAQPYRTTETRIQLSVRTKLAQGLLTGAGPARDSLWFGYTQQSYWQLFTGALSRPFRSTDHEPEFVYVYPSQLALPGNWQLRYSGLGVVHQSNGQTLPLSRSWNRVYLMAGADHAGGLSLQGRVWQRIPESASTDDNPEISNYIGRAELSGAWDFNVRNTLALTLRHSLRAENKGSARLEWLRTLGNVDASGPFSGLRLHAQLFNGYGDSLLDYNRRRTMLSVGLSLVDW